MILRAHSSFQMTQNDTVFGALCQWSVLIFFFDFPKDRTHKKIKIFVFEREWGFLGQNIYRTTNVILLPLLPYERIHILTVTIVQIMSSTISKGSNLPLLPVPYQRLFALSLPDCVLKRQLKPHPMRAIPSEITWQYLNFI